MIAQKPFIGNDIGIWTSDYPFVWNGVPGTIVYDEEYRCLWNFSIGADNPAQRKAVAEAIRDIILQEGRSVTSDEWTNMDG